MSIFQVTREGAVAVLTHDDGKANTFVQTTLEELVSVLDGIERSDATALLYRGRTDYFSAGLNLKVLPSLSPEGWRGLIRSLGNAVLKLFLFGKPVIAEVTGHAIGAGAMLAFAADVRIVAKGNYKFGLNEVLNGLPVPTFGVEVARAALAQRNQTELILHGKLIGPDEALALGIAEAVVEDVHAAALARATALAALPSRSYATTKRNLRGAAAEAARAKVAAEAQGLADAAADGRSSR